MYTLAGAGLAKRLSQTRFNLDNAISRAGIRGLLSLPSTVLQRKQSLGIVITDFVVLAVRYHAGLFEIAQRLDLGGLIVVAVIRTDGQVVLA